MLALSSGLSVKTTSEMFEEEVLSSHQADSGFEPEEDVADYGMSRVFYSDVPLPDNSPRASKLATGRRTTSSPADWWMVIEIMPTPSAIPSAEVVLHP